MSLFLVARLSTTRGLLLLSTWLFLEYFPAPPIQGHFWVTSQQSLSDSVLNHWRCDPQRTTVLWKHWVLFVVTVKILWHLLMDWCAGLPIMFSLPCLWRFIIFNEGRACITISKEWVPIWLLNCCSILQFTFSLSFEVAKTIALTIYVFHRFFL